MPLASNDLGTPTRKQTALPIFATHRWISFDLALDLRECSLCLLASSAGRALLIDVLLRKTHAVSLLLLRASAACLDIAQPQIPLSVAIFSRPCPLWAKSGHRVTYSITSSATKKNSAWSSDAGADHGSRARDYFAAAGRQIACFPPVRNGASIQARSRYIREIPDPSRSFTHLDRKMLHGCYQ